MANELERSGSRDRSINRVESRVAHATRKQASRIDGLDAGALSGARLLEGLELTTSPQLIEHGLGDAVQGAFVVRRSASGLGPLLIAETTNDRVWAGLYLEDGAGTVSVVVF